jgi:hypothetical protein
MTDPAGCLLDGKAPYDRGGEEDEGEAISEEVLLAEIGL